MILILRWIINSCALLLLAKYLPGINVSGWYAAIIAAFILGLINTVIRPVLIFLTLPLNILTLGLFTLVINGLMFWLTSSIVKGFTVDGFWPAFFGALIVTVIGWISGAFLRKN